MTRRPPSAVHLLVVVGTRPEAIKLAPVVRALRASDWARVTVVDSGQHDELTRQALAAVELTADVRVPLTRVDHTLTELLTGLLGGLDAVLADAEPDVVLVQGDTTSALAGAQAAFHRGIPVGHVEAGLRSGDPLLPFPEEANRRMIAALARWHFAPTARAAEQLRAEGVAPAAVFLTGNPIVDELQRTLAAADGHGEAPVAPGRRLLVATLHRRESIGPPIEAILRAIGRIADAHPDLDVWLPLHANPQVAGPVRAALGDRPQVRLAAAADYPRFLRRLAAAALVVTDSGGVTEEAAVLGVPTLVVRERTERTEAIEAGVAELVGTDEQRIVSAATRALAATAPRPGSGAFGDGDAGLRIAAVLREQLRPGSAVEVEQARSLVED